MSTLEECPVSFQELKEKLATNELQVEQELLTTPVLLQMVCDEATRLGMILDGLKIDEKAMAATVYLYHKKDGAGRAKAPTQNDLEAEVNSNEQIISIRHQIKTAKATYDRWYDLQQNYQNKLKSLVAYKDLIVSGYVGYKRPYTGRRTSEDE